MAPDERPKELTPAPRPASAAKRGPSKPIRTQVGRWGRRLPTQIAALIAFNGYFWAKPGKALCLPVLNCYSCPVGTVACPIGTISEFARMRRFPLYVMGMLGILGLAVGRAFCGWACPFGFLQDCLYRIPSRKWWLPRFYDYLKYAFLIVLVIGVPLWMSGLVEKKAEPAPVAEFDFGGIGGESFALADEDVTPPEEMGLGEKADLPAAKSGDSIIQEGSGKIDYCSAFCPAGSLEAGLPAMRLPSVRKAAGWRTFGKFGILAFILGLAVVVRRSFCRGFCPLGALMAFSSRFSMTQLRTDDSKCTRCMKCVRVCPTRARHLPFGETKTEATWECVLCLDCVRNCPEDGALSACIAGRAVTVSRRGAQALPKRGAKKGAQARPERKES